MSDPLDFLSSLERLGMKFGLENIATLCAALGHPEHTFKSIVIAGTNGKGSVTVMVETALRAAGHRAARYTSPHLVRLEERFVIDGREVETNVLREVVGSVQGTIDSLMKNGRLEALPTFFECTTAVAFELFRRAGVQVAVLEVGLGGRLDATNVVTPIATAITSIDFDHQAQLGTTLESIAREKAGIAKPGAPLVTQRYSDSLFPVMLDAAARNRTQWFAMGETWDAAAYRDRLHYRDDQGHLETPLPRLPGAHQVHNAALAFAMLRHQSVVPVREAALKAAPLWAHWPARLQRLDHGPLLAPLPENSEAWLDGGHNAGAGEAIAAFFTPDRLEGQKLQLVIGMLSNKDLDAYLVPFAGRIAHIHVLPVRGHDHHPPERFAAIANLWGISCTAHDTAEEAIKTIAAAGNAAPKLLIAGSLYLAGEILRLNGQYPD